MTDRSIKKRITDLENQSPDRPIKALYQDWDNPDLWFDNTERVEGESIPWDEMVKRYPGCDFAIVTYDKKWIASDDE